MTQHANLQYILSLIFNDICLASKTEPIDFQTIILSLYPRIEGECIGVILIDLDHL